MERVEKWSKEFENDGRIFHLTKAIELGTWTGGYNWAKNEKMITNKDCGDVALFFVQPEKKRICQPPIFPTAKI